MNRRPRVLVTGATGFLGRNILAAMRTRDDLEVIAACRNPQGLPTDFTGERRIGDLLDAEYRAAAVRDVEVICHAGTWGSVWGHAEEERSRFLEPTTALIEQAIASHVGRFIMSSSIAAGAPPLGGLLDDLAPGKHTGFWPHLDRLIDVEEFMRANARRGTTMVTLRLGEFVGRGNTLGLVPALAPRLRTRLVPLIAGGRSRLPLIADTDLGQAFLLAAVAPQLDHYESLNICGGEFPSMREVFDFLSTEGGLPKAWYSVPKWAAYVFGWLMEHLHPILPGKAPFLARAIVYLAEDWPCAVERAESKLGYRPQKGWRTAAREALGELRVKGYPWPTLA